MTGQQSPFSIHSCAASSNLFLSPVNSYYWASEMAQQAKAPAAMPDLSWNPKNHKVKRENRFPCVVPWPLLTGASSPSIFAFSLFERSFGYLLAKLDTCRGQGDGSEVKGTGCSGQCTQAGSQPPVTSFRGDNSFWPPQARHPHAWNINKN